MFFQARRNYEHYECKNLNPFYKNLCTFIKSKNNLHQILLNCLNFFQISIETHSVTTNYLHSNDSL